MGDLGSVVAPPFDVISSQTQAALHDASPYNVIRLEYGFDAPSEEGDRYQRAAATLAAWLGSGVLAVDDTPSYYLYEQEFEHDDHRYRRRTILGRARLEPRESGQILPHEHTMSGPKEDRLQLLRACRANVSPIYCLYRSDGGEAVRLCDEATAGVDAAEAIDSAGQRHRLCVVDQPDTVARLERHFRNRTLYIADGHHRYETALAYRDERRSAARHWTGEEPENFALMGLTAADDPGLLILPIHRLVRPLARPEDPQAALRRTFDLQSPTARGGDDAELRELLAGLRREAAEVTALGALGIGSAAILLRLRDRAAVERLMPADHSEAWRRLDVNVLQYGILEPLFGIDLETVRAGGHLEFTESAEEAWRAVQEGRAPLAFLLNATRPEEIFAVADSGDRMPQKSTYFYPKLGTGLVLYALDAGPAAGASAR